MNIDALFSSVDTEGIASFVSQANNSICYAAPGIRLSVADAMIDASHRLGPELVTVCLDFDEGVIRMGYGDLIAVERLRQAGIEVRSSPGLRTALVVVDKAGFIFTPTALYLEKEPNEVGALNAIRMSEGQIAEALARLSPVAKMIAIAQVKTPEEKQRIEALPVDVGSEKVTDAEFANVEENLKLAPPVQFDLARQVRVFEAYLQYVELNLSGAAIQRHRLGIPQSIQKLGGSQKLAGRLKTTFDLIEKNSRLSSKPLEDKLNDIRKNLTPSLGKDHGRVVLKNKKPLLEQRLKEFREELENHQNAVKKELQNYLNQSRNQIVDYYVPRVISNPPDALSGQLLYDAPTQDDAKLWLSDQLDRIFPSAESLIQDMKLEVRYKDVTFETLNQATFLKSIKEAFPQTDWDKAYSEFKAAAEKSE